MRLCTVTHTKFYITDTAENSCELNSYHVSHFMRILELLITADIVTATTKYVSYAMVVCYSTNVLAVLTSTTGHLQSTDKSPIKFRWRDIAPLTPAY